MKKSTIILIALSITILNLIFVFEEFDVFHAIINLIISLYIIYFISVERKLLEYIYSKLFFLVVLIFYIYGDFLFIKYGYSIRGDVFYVIPFISLLLLFAIPYYLYIDIPFYLRVSKIAEFSSPFLVNILFIYFGVKSYFYIKKHNNPLFMKKYKLFLCFILINLLISTAFAFR